MERPVQAWEMSDKVEVTLIWSSGMRRWELHRINGVITIKGNPVICNQFGIAFVECGNHEGKGTAEDVVVPRLEVKEPQRDLPKAEDIRFPELPMPKKECCMAPDVKNDGKTPNLNNERWYWNFHCYKCNGSWSEMGEAMTPEEIVTENTPRHLRKKKL